MPKKSAPTREPVSDLNLDIGDGGVHFEVQKSLPWCHPILRVSHSSFGHGSTIEVHPSRQALRELGRFFNRMARDKRFKGDYCYAAGRRIYVDGAVVHPKAILRRVTRQPKTKTN